MILINTSKGDIRIKLHKDATPKTVANFLEYVRSGFYEDTIFHRVIDGFMIQGGGLTNDMQTKKTNGSVANEAASGQKNNRGTISMARTSAPHSATAQFFINLKDNSFLNYKNDSQDGFGYCVFGEVVDGMDVVDTIAKVKTGNRMGHGDVPVDEVKITKVSEVEA